MKVAIMQPYFFPYIGYFQLMNAVDEFVLYDNIEFTKRGWINRNRILLNRKVAFITLPLKKDSDYLDVRDRCLADTWQYHKQKLLHKITEAYRKAPYFDVVYPVIEQSILFEEHNLFIYILNSLNLVKEYLEIPISLVTSSTISIEHGLKAANKIIALCKARHATVYVNPVGGLELYSTDAFKNEGIELCFLKTSEIQYNQFNNDFVPMLSILDVMMFNSKQKIKEYLRSFYTLV